MTIQQSNDIIQWAEHIQGLLTDAPSEGMRRGREPLIKETLQFVEWMVKANMTSRRSENVPLCRARDVIEEMLGLAGLFATDGLGMSTTVIKWPSEYHREQTKLMSLLNSLIIRQVAVPYLWDHDLRAAAHAQVLPRHTVEIQTPHPFMYWTSDVDLQEPDSDSSLIAVLITQVGPILSSQAIISHKDSHVECRGGRIAHTGQRYPDDFSDNTPARETYEGIAKMLAFVNSPFLMHRVERPDRGFRRRLLTAKQPLNFDVQFIDLRRVETTTSKNQDVEETYNRDYHWRWLVSGHIRNQWYPTTQSHKLIWIQPYIKGPEDRPLKPRAYHVKR